jgi:uncharacterized protein (DUF849 family)
MKKSSHTKKSFALRNRNVGKTSEGEKMEKLIITVALIGNTTNRDKNPNPPMTPKEIAESAIESYHAGATACHVHVRHPITHAMSIDPELFREVVDRIREKCDMVINLTTGTGARLLYDPEKNAWDTSGLKSAEERIAHVLRIRPEICSLDIGSINMSGSRAAINLIPMAEKMAALAKTAGVKPEMEIFDVGNIRLAKGLIEKGLAGEPSLFQFCLGMAGGIEATLENLVFMLRLLPEHAVWSAFGLGHSHFPIAAASIIAGGHVRVGFEDNLYIQKGVLATSNAQMVKKVMEIANLMGREVATAQEARQILGLVKR